MFGYLNVMFQALHIVSLPLQILTLILAVFLFFCEIVGIFTVISWCFKGTPKGFKKNNKAGLTKDEYKWLHGNK